MGIRVKPLRVFVSTIVVMTLTVSCVTDLRRSSGDDLRRTTEEFFTRASEFWNGDPGEGAFDSVSEMSAWHEANETRMTDLRGSFDQWSRALDREGDVPALLDAARDRFAVMIDDFEEQVAITRGCLDDPAADSPEMVSLCLAVRVSLRLDDWERHHREAYDAWERWRASGG